VLIWLSQPFRSNIPFWNSSFSLLLGVLSMLLGTLLNVAFAGALGMLASTLNSRIGIAITIARVIHLAIIFSMVALIFLLVFQTGLRAASEIALYNVLVGSALSTLDGGLTLSQTLTNSNNLSWDYLVTALVLVIGAALLFAGLIWAVLRLAEYLLARQNALAVGSR
jgi:hypothetical protein